MRSWRVGALVAIAFAAGCSCPSGKPDDAEVAAAWDRPSEPSVAPLPAWGGGSVEASAALEDAELARDLEAPAIAEAMGSEALRTRAIWAVARIGGAPAAQRLIELLDAKANATATELAALSFLEPPEGELEEGSVWWTLEDAVWTRYAVTEEPARAEALLLAIARIGGGRSQVRLAADIAEVADDSTSVHRVQSALEAMGMLCARGFGLDGVGLDGVARALEGEVALARAGAYAVGRCAGPSAEQLAGSERGELMTRLGAQLDAEDPESTRLALKGMVALGEVPEGIARWLLPEPRLPWQLEVEAVRVAAGHADGRRALVDQLAGLTAASINGTRVHVVMAALRGLADAVVGSPEYVQQLATLTSSVAAARRDSNDPRRTKELALVGCELAVLTAITDGNIEAVEGCATGVEGLPTSYGRVLAVEAILRVGAAVERATKTQMLLARAEAPSAVVAQAAVAALADVDDIRVSEVLRRALVRDDAGVKAAAATAIATRAVDRSRRDPSAVSILRGVLRAVDNGTGVEARISAVQALGNLARSGAPQTKEAADGPAPPPEWLGDGLLPLATDPAVAVRRAARKALEGYPGLVSRFDDSVGTTKRPFSARVESMLTEDRAAPAKRWIVHTDAGSMTIELRAAPAPIAQSVLTSLAAEGYFDGLTFHRVVPGFVIQGGDPRSDGYGGPGFLTPCERSNLRYERGSVGIALAGQDTGGSQFFVAHNREPRLDARYPIVGQVIEGLDVLDAILPYDRITRIEAQL